MRFTRRQFVAAGLIGAGMAKSAAAGVLPATAAQQPPAPLRKRALAALERHDSAIAKRDLIGIADYGAHSHAPRFYLLDIASGRSEALLVAHGRGSDPKHSGWLQSFSNVPGSLASSAGAYLTSVGYSGTHGPSRRLIGLEERNSNAEARAIVIHGAWYVGKDIVDTQGKLGRSEGCFAFSESDIGQVLERLGPGRLLYADKL